MIIGFLSIFYVITVIKKNEIFLLRIFIFTNMSMFLRMVKISKSYHNNKNKKLQNELFIQQIKKMCKMKNFDLLDNNSFIGILDSIEGNTTKMLLSNGLKKDNILIIECKKDIVRKHLRRGIPCHYGTLESFADDKYDDIYVQADSNWRNYNCIGWYFDTSGHVSKQGSQILLVLNKTSIQSGCVLSFTFCKARILQEKHEENMNIFIQNLITFFEKKSLTLSLIHNYCYSGDGNGKRGSAMEWSLYVVKNI